jgi:hypothetical protein
MGKAHPEAWAAVDTQFRDTASRRLAVSKITGRDSAYTSVANRLRYPVSQTSDPRFELLCFSYRYHICIVF